MATRANGAAAILVLFAAGCSAQQDAGMGAGAGGRATLSPTAATPVPTTVADVAADRDAAADAYRRFWVVAYALDSHPVTEWPTRLAAVATEPLLPKLLHALKAQHASGIREYGQVRPRPVTVEVRGDVATIFDCQDASGAGEAYADTGMPKTVGDTRTPIAASMRRGPDRHWRVSGAKQLDGTC